MSQKKFGQLHIKVWFPEPEGGRYEEYTTQNRSGEEFREIVNQMIARLRKAVPE